MSAGMTQWPALWGPAVYADQAPWRRVVSVLYFTQQANRIHFHTW